MKNFYYQCAVFYIAIATFILLWQVNRIQLIEVKDAAKFNLREFAENYSKIFDRIIQITRKYIWIYAFFLLTGIHLGYLDAIRHLGNGLRIAIHLTFLSILIYFFKQGIKKEASKNKRGIRDGREHTERNGTIKRAFL